MLEFAPRFDTAAAARVAAEWFGLSGTARPLFSERDQNFLIASPDGQQAVLKIANARETRALLEAQQAALAYVAGGVDVTPRIVPTRTGERLVEIAGADGSAHLAWAITVVPGAPLANVHQPASALLADFGRRVAGLRRAMAGFDRPAAHREFQWDLARARQVVAEQRHLVRDAELGVAIDTVTHAFDAHIAPYLDALPRAVVHGDLNDYNVLVGAPAGTGEDLRVTGIVDFGDMVHSYAVADLAIAVAYALLDAADPLSAMIPMVAAYHAEWPLSEAELAAVFGLAALVAACCTPYGWNSMLASPGLKANLRY